VQTTKQDGQIDIELSFVNQDYPAFELVCGVQNPADPAIAVNNDGVLAVIWQETFRSGCWRFAVSSDGQSLSRSDV